MLATEHSDGDGPVATRLIMGTVPLPQLIRPHTLGRVEKTPWDSQVSSLSDLYQNPVLAASDLQRPDCVSRWWLRLVQFL